MADVFELKVLADFDDMVLHGQMVFMKYLKCEKQRLRYNKSTNYFRVQFI